MRCGPSPHRIPDKSKREISIGKAAEGPLTQSYKRLNRRDRQLAADPSGGEPKRLSPILFEVDYGQRA